MQIMTDQIKAHEADHLATSLLRSTEKLFQDPKIQAEFEKWKQERQERQKKGA